MNLSEMPAGKLLDEYEQTFEDGPLASFDKLNKAYELRAELLRRLQPVKATCPKCGSGRLITSTGGRSFLMKIWCEDCPESSESFYPAKLADFAQFFTCKPIGT